MALKNGKYLKKIKIEIENISPVNISGDDGYPLIDRESNKVYIPGTTIAGAMRSYLKINDFKNLDKLFGENNFISKLYVYDSYSDFKGIEVRPGVSINRFSGAANSDSKKGGKFERIYVVEGHKFIIDFEIYDDDKSNFEEYAEAIYSSIAAIDDGNITFGLYKTGGAGIFKVNSVKEVNYDFTSKKDLFMFLKNSKEYKNKNIKEICLNNLYNDSFVSYELNGEIETPLLIKGISMLDYTRADDEQFCNINGEYIIPGTSLKGVIRSHGERILKFYHKENYINKIFGPLKEDEEKRKSRFTVFDTKIESSNKVIYSKTKIDRFTGGIIKGQKMEEEPVTGKVLLRGNLKINKKTEEDEAIGLIALIFRDIAKGELTLGSGNNIGRGRIKGNQLKISIGNQVIFKGNLDKNVIEINKIDRYIAALGK